MGMVGLPRFSRKIVLAVANAPASRRLIRWLLHPSTGWIAFAPAFWLRHAPAPFWRPVILAFSDRVIYARYSSVDDQALDGLIMWVPGSLPLLLPILRLIVQLSSGRVVMDGHPLPGVAQVAMQQGRYAGRLIQRRIVAKSAPPPFHYFDKGTMAVVGRGFAVLQSGRVRLSGLLAWLAWAAVHLEFLGQSSLRVSVFVQWVWMYLTGQRGSRLIVTHHGSRQLSIPNAASQEAMQSVSGAVGGHCR